jgi:shikimate dehydrogenase
MHNAAFRHFGVDARYELRPLESDQLEDFFAEVRQEDWLGFQVTSPHKQAAMALVDEVELDAAAIGAINSGLRTPEGRLVGFNTDAPGFARSVNGDLRMSLAGANVVVVGAGGAARAVVHACLNAGAARVHIANRTPGRASELATEIDDPVVTAGGVDDSLDAALHQADLAVNATTVGMTTEGVSFDVRQLPTNARVFDLVYVPATTDLVDQARARGLMAVNGLGMLVGQAAIAFERWTGIADADSMMRQAIGQLADSTAEDSMAEDSTAQD